MKTSNVALLRGCMLVLAGVLAAGCQLSGPGEPSTLPAGCPVPDGVVPAQELSVTAEEVENGEAFLADFVLQARKIAMSVDTRDTIRAWAYYGCLNRQEGGPWWYGDTYLVTLIPGLVEGDDGIKVSTGRIYFHAKDMALAGRALKPEIFASIGDALGFTLTKVGITEIGEFTQENGAEFTATDVSGYAVGYNSQVARNAAIIMAGFDVQESHLVDETIDFPAPDITASEVVDKDTLKIFVTDAANLLRDLLVARNNDRIAQYGIALRDDTGDWKHGPVYLFAMDDQGYTFFHGGFPNKFALQIPTDTLRDAVTGRLILPQIIEAAQTPDGGFVEYHFDNPDDDTDSAEILKITYAREFTIGPLSIIVGAGIYSDE